MRRYLAIMIWKLANKIARIGCRVRGSHIDPKDFKRDGYCQQCGLLRQSWRLPADAPR